jgi:hypothetical protein
LSKPFIDTELQERNAAESIIRAATLVNQASDCLEAASKKGNKTNQAICLLAVARRFPPLAAALERLAEAI